MHLITVFIGLLRMLTAVANNTHGLPIATYTTSTPNDDRNISPRYMALVDDGPNQEIGPFAAKTLHFGDDSSVSKFVARDASSRRTEGVGRGGDNDDQRRKKPLSHIKATILSVLLYVSIVKWVDEGRRRHFWVGFIAVLYLVEALTCSTRRYFSNVVTMKEMDDRLSMLKRATPIVTWYLECFHYGYRYDNDDSFHYGHHRRRRRRHGDTSTREKIITSRAYRRFELPSWQDNTATVLWDQKMTIRSARGRMKPYTKMTLSKTLLFSNPRILNEFSSQQSAFVAVEGRRDLYHELSIGIEVDGFEPKTLVTRTSDILSSPFNFFGTWYFWIFTFMGLTVPYRIWFSRQCDEMSIAIVKETI